MAIATPRRCAGVGFQADLPQQFRYAVYSSHILSGAEHLGHRLAYVGRRILDSLRLSAFASLTVKSAAVLCGKVRCGFRGAFPRLGTASVHQELDTFITRFFNSAIKWRPDFSKGASAN
jgi:hypothetical protein